MLQRESYVVTIDKSDNDALMAIHRLTFEHPTLGVQEVISCVINARNNVTVTLDFGSPKDDNEVEYPLNIQVSARI